MTKYFTKEELENVVKESYSYADVLRKLNRTIFGSAYHTLKKYLKIYNINTSHFLGRGHLKNKTHNWHPKIPLKNILIANSSYSSMFNLKKRLLKENLLIYKCYECGLFEWNNKPISLQLHHINGIHNDHRIENLCLLCPNCHSQTDNFTSKKTKEKITNKKRKIKLCECGEEICNSSTICKACFNKTRPTKIDWPPIENLINLVNKSSLLAVGKILGVSDNAVRKRIKKYS